MLKFDYQFMSDTEGLLTVYFDNQVVYVADERNAKTEARSAVDIPLAKQAEPGNHFIVFRLDTFNPDHSTIRIENIAIGRMPRTAFPWTMFLPAITSQH